MTEKDNDSDGRETRARRQHSALIRRVSDAFDAAEQLTGEALDLYMLGLHESDPEVAQQLEEILETGADFDEFFGTVFTAAQPPDGASLLLNEVFKGYRAVEKVGEGGMGVVYRAVNEHETFDQQVAIKVLRQRWLSSAVRMRFQHEAQILTTLDHPNIAPIINVGSHSGNDKNDYPFLIMQYVDGERLDTYCLHNKLSIRQRLRLFLNVLDAVSYAQGRGVIHRDLKPTNIFVNRDGTVKLLDFGVAKIMSDDTPSGAELTQMMGPIFSRIVAAPEQWSDQRQSMATDVYALGIVLYKLLCGDYPFSLEAIKRAREEGNWPQPLPSMTATFKGSSDEKMVADNRQCTARELTSFLEGDLRAIVHKATQLEPSDRYAFAAEMRLDILRFLENRPVEAARTRPVRTARMWIARNRLVAGISAGLVSALGAGLLQVYFDAREDVIHAREIAQERDKAKAVSELFRNALATSDPALEGANMVTVREALIRAGIEVREAADIDAETRMELALTVGQILTQLGAFKEAQPLLELVVQLGAGAGNTPATGRAIADALIAQVDIKVGLGNYQDALAAFSVARAAIEANFDTPSHRMLLLLNSHAEIYANWQKLERFEQAAAQANDYAVKFSDLPAEGRAVALNNLALSKRATRPLEKTVEMLETAQTIALSELPESHPIVARIRANLAASYVQGKDPEAAAAVYRQVIATIGAQGVTPNRSMAQAAYGLGIVQLGRGRPEEAQVLLEQALEVQRRFRSAHDIQSIKIRYALATAHDLLNELEQASAGYASILRDLRQHAPGSVLEHRVLLRMTAQHITKTCSTAARPLLAQCRTAMESAPRVSAAERDFFRAMELMCRSDESKNGETRQTIRSLLRAIRDANGEHSLPGIKAKQWLNMR